MISLDTSRGDNFCIAPWVNLHIQTHGAIKPCCGGGKDEGDGNFGFAQDGNWKYINGTSTKLSNFKRSLLNNEKVSYCEGCHEKSWYSEFLDQSLSVTAIDDFLFKSVDLRWGTTCQLSCLYCGPYSSSTWQRLESKKKVIPIEKSRSYDGMFDQLFEFLEKNHSQISRVSLLGGEPLLLKENHRLLDIIPSFAHVEIFTNLNMDLETNLLYQKLISRPNVNWYVSMENIGDRFEFVRRGADWKTQYQNIKKLKQDTQDQSGQHISLQSQFCVYSALNLAELYDCFSSLDIHINWAVLEGPEVLNFMQYPKKLKEKCIVDIDNIISRHREEDMFSLKSVRERLVLSLDSEDSSIIQDCREWHRRQKQNYFPDQTWEFDELWPVYQEFQKNLP